MRLRYIYRKGNYCAGQLVSLWLGTDVPDGRILFLVLLNLISIKIKEFQSHRYIPW